MPSAGSRIWVFDTSSIIEVRRLHGLPPAKQSAVLQAMGELVAANGIVFPREVLAELERGCEGKEPDPRYLWAKAHAEQACRTADFERVAAVLARVPLLVDTEKTTGAEEADPYVVALAHALLEQGQLVTVVTQDRVDKPMKVSLATACGLWGIATVPLRAFLEHVGIWARI